MYKVKSCCINGCKNQNIGPDSGVIFYKFPDEKPLKKRWVEACLKNDTTKDKNWTPNNETVICNVHFVTGMLLYILSLSLINEHSVSFCG